MNKILIVDDNTELAEILEDILGSSYVISKSTSIANAKYCLENENIDLVLLDLGLPDGSGFEVCSYIKNKDKIKHLPIIIISGNIEVSAKVAGFELGADDYIEKPFNYDELQARIKSKIKKMSETPTVNKKVGFFLIDNAKLKVFEGHDENNEIPLSPMEFRILSHFLAHPQQVFNRDQLISVCSGEGHVVTDRTIDTHIYSLRKKINSEYGNI